MTIKKQFILLSAIITAIPVFCAAFVGMNRYLMSSDRYLLNSYREVRKLDSGKISHEDRKKLFDTLRLLPPDVQSVMLAGDSSVIISTIPEITAGTVTSQENIWRLIDGTSDVYFYQFTSVPYQNGEQALLITRIPRDKHDVRKKQSMIPTLIVFLFITVAICLLFIIAMTRSIFRSIGTLERQTQQIADGDLSVTPEINMRNPNEITSIAGSLEKMRRSLLEAQNRKNRFIMGISHDLRTPVAIIKGYAEAVSDEVITGRDDIKQAADLIGAKSSQLEDMIDSLLSFMKLDEAEIRENLERESISSLIKEFAEDAKITGNVFKRDITADISLPDGICIPLDRQLVTRAFGNLFTNAIRYTKDGDSIRISAEKQEGSILFSIADTGSGIEEKDLAHIFDLFYRGTNSRREEGMGIGLSVVKNVMDIHGWNIDVDARPGFGTKFTVTIPVPEQSAS